LDEVKEIMKSSIFWDITHRKSLKINRRFGTGGKQTSSFHLLHAGFFLGLFFDPRRWRRQVPPKRRLTFQRATRRYIPENRILLDHLCENLKPYREIMFKNPLTHTFF
jgi:hypothetical protein